jgi:hypothetical protein
LKLAIHQPHYFPYPGFFHKLALSDAFVVMDATQYDRRFTNRNRILDPHGEVWLTVPIEKSGKFLPNREVRVNNSIPWKQEHWKKLLVSYANAEHFDRYASDLRRFYEKDWTFLLDLDVESTKMVLEWLGMTLPIIMESDLDLRSTGTQRLVDICEAVGADVYVSGSGGKAYMDESLFSRRGIGVEHQSYSPLPYAQRFSGPFVPDLSVLDMLFNIGPGTSVFIGTNKKWPLAVARAALPPL